MVSGLLKFVKTKICIPFESVIPDRRGVLDAAAGGQELINVVILASDPYLSCGLFPEGLHEHSRRSQLHVLITEYQ